MSKTLMTCPECGQTGKGLWCYHWDMVGTRRVPTIRAAKEKETTPKEDK